MSHTTAQLPNPKRRYGTPIWIALAARGGAVLLAGGLSLILRLFHEFRADLEVSRSHVRGLLSPASRASRAEATSSTITAI